MKLSMIVAQSENRVIGRNNKLPWNLPEDLRYFKQVTMGKPIIMGRKTYESIGRPLPGRLNIVITRSRDYARTGIEVVHSLDEALAQAASFCEINGQAEALIIGGADLYAQALPLTQRLYLTQVHATVEGDAFFPHLAGNAWREVGAQRFSADGCNPYDYSFQVLERIA